MLNEHLSKLTFESLFSDESNNGFNSFTSIWEYIRQIEKDINIAFDKLLG